MKRVQLSKRAKRWTVRALVLSATLIVIACDNDVNINPVAPTLPNWTFPSEGTAGPGRSLEIHGSLAARQGSLIEATVLYDGKELAGGRTACLEESGCGKLDLTAEAESAPGNHTISFQVISQSTESIEYVAEGRVRVSRENLPLVMTLDLEQTRATLRPGESVTFEVAFQSFEN